MTAIFLDPATIYQIFYMRYKGLSATSIARELSISRNCVTWHLQFRYLSHYPEATLRRIKLLNPRRRPISEPKHPWIRLCDTSYFFPSRPAPKTLMVSPFFKKLRTKSISGLTVTKREWIYSFLGKHLSEMPSGLCFNHAACRRLSIEAPKATWVDDRLHGGYTRYADAPEVRLHRDTIAKALQIQEWTRLPFVSLDAIDIVHPLG